MSMTPVTSMPSRDLFPSLLHTMGLRGNGAEIGVAHGKFSEKWIPSSPLAKVFLIDPWKEYGAGEYLDGNNQLQSEQDRRFKMVCEKMAKYGDRVQIMRMESIEASKQFPNDFFDFLYIDANHQYQYVKTDLQIWYPKMRAGGVFAGHDYNNSVGNRKNRFGELSLCGVKSAVDEFCASLGIEVKVTGGTRRIPPSWYFVIPTTA
jgi:hypothetical protein